MWNFNCLSTRTVTHLHQQNKPNAFNVISLWFQVTQSSLFGHRLYRGYCILQKKKKLFQRYWPWGWLWFIWFRCFWLCNWLPIRAVTFLYKITKPTAWKNEFNVISLNQWLQVTQSTLRRRLFFKKPPSQNKIPTAKMSAWPTICGSCNVRRSPLLVFDAIRIASWNKFSES